MIYKINLLMLFGFLFMCVCVFLIFLKSHMFLEYWIPG